MPVDGDRRGEVLARIELDALRSSFAAVLDLLQASSPNCGVADIVCWGPDQAGTDTAAAAVAIALAAEPSTREPAFRRVHVVAYGEGAESNIRARAIDLLVAVNPAQSHLAVTFFDARVRLVSPDSLDAGWLESQIARSSDRCAWVVAGAGDYSDNTARSGETVPRWIETLVRTARRLHGVNEAYVLLLAGRYIGSDEGTREILLTAPGAVRAALDPAESVTVAMRQCIAMASKGDLGAAFDTIARATLNEAQRSIARALCAASAGEPRAYNYVRDHVAALLEATPENVAFIADIAITDATARAHLLRHVAHLQKPVRRLRPLVDVALAHLEQRLRGLDRLNENTPEFHELVESLQIAVEYLAHHPSDGSRRVRLSNALSTEACGPNGFVLLVWFALHNASTPALVDPVHSPADPSASIDEFVEFLSEYWSRRSMQRSFALMPEPGSVATKHSPSALLAAGLRLLEKMGMEAVADDADTQALMSVAKACLDLAASSSQRVGPQRIMRIAAAGLASAGAHQLARDIAEQTLAISKVGTPANERWLAWITFADIYHRGHNTLEALLAWVCAHAQDGITANPQDVFPAITLFARMLRDIGAHQDALQQVARARVLLQATPYFEINAHQVEDLESSIKLRQLLDDGGSEEEWQSVAESLAASVQRALRDGEVVSVPAVLLGQLIRRYRLEDKPVPIAAQTAFNDALSTVGEPLVSRLRAFSALAPDIDTVRSSAWGISGARYARDLGEDLLFVSVLASRALEGAAVRRDAAGVLFAVEMLADHSVRLRQRSREPSAEHGLAALMRDPSRLVEFAQEVSLRGVTIHALSLAEDGRLVHVSAADGRINDPILESRDIFDSDAVERWNREQRPKLSTAPDGEVTLNTMENRLQKIGLSVVAPPGPHLLVRSRTVGEVPANLLLSGGELLGTTAPVASVPSLSWLASELETPRVVPGGRTAWLLQERQGAPSALSILHDALQRTLPAFGVQLVRAELAESLASAGLAIVAGHGALWGGERYFRSVGGEDSSSYSPSSIVRWVGGAAAVVLLVCSGGRMDGDFLSARGIGLPHMLLDAGCGAVVASPWPISASMAGRWLQPLMEALDLGFPIGEAAHYANLVLRDVSVRVSDYLAMHVFGNPFLEIPRPVSGQTERVV